VREITAQGEALIYMPEKKHFTGDQWNSGLLERGTVGRGLGYFPHTGV